MILYRTMCSGPVEWREITNTMVPVRVPRLRVQVVRVRVRVLVRAAMFCFMQWTILGVANYVLRRNFEISNFDSLFF